MAAGLAMSRCREPSTGSLGSASAFSGDGPDEEQHIYGSAVAVREDDRGGGSGRFGIYQGNWGGNRRKAELPEMTN
jgi:hypothetical protein